jgi:hypothetical protein
MKKSTTMKAALLLLVCGLALADSGETTEEHTYSFGVQNFRASGNGLSGLADRATVESYLANQGCIMGNRTYTGSSAADRNAQAQADLNASKAKINSAILSASLTSATVSFTYTCTAAGFTGTGFSFSKQRG